VIVGQNYRLQDIQLSVVDADEVAWKPHFSVHDEKLAQEARFAATLGRSAGGRMFRRHT
jgi:hypothetical protein